MAAKKKKTKSEDAQTEIPDLGEPKQGILAGTKSESYGKALKCKELKHDMEAAKRKFNAAMEALCEQMTKDGVDTVQVGQLTFTREGKEVMKLTGYKFQEDE